MHRPFDLCNECANIRVCLVTRTSSTNHSTSKSYGRESQHDFGRFLFIWLYGNSGKRKRVTRCRKPFLLSARQLSYIQLNFFLFHFLSLLLVDFWKRKWKNCPKYLPVLCYGRMVQSKVTFIFNVEYPCCWEHLNIFYFP